MTLTFLPVTVLSIYDSRSIKTTRHGWVIHHGLLVPKRFDPVYMIYYATRHRIRYITRACWLFGSIQLKSTHLTATPTA